MNRLDITTLCEDHLKRTKRILERADISKQARDQFEARLKVFQNAKFTEYTDEFYFNLRRLKREIMLADAELAQFDDILAVQTSFPLGLEAPHEARFRSESTAPLGASLLHIKNIKGRVPVVQSILEIKEPYAISRPDLSFDAKKVVFGMKSKSDTNYHLFESDIDGANLRQITKSKYNDFDPIYLTDGTFVFSSSRVNDYIRCGDSSFHALALTRCDNNGKIYALSAQMQKSIFYQF